MVQFQGFTVEIIVDGQPAKEHDDDDDRAPDSDISVTKYVEAVSGKEFYFAIKIDPLYRWGKSDTITARPLLDGKRRTGICILKRHVSPHMHRVYKIDGEWSGIGSSAKHYHFVFADLQTRDMHGTDEMLEMKENYGNLGLLTLHLWREQELYQSDATTDASMETLAPVPEKALKGQALQVATTFKTCPGGTRPRTSATRHLDKHPFLTFNFKYRTRKDLQTLMVLERSPSPIPLEDRDPEDLSREELEELVRRQRANEAIKREHKSVKRERAHTSSTPMPQLKSSKGANGQTVYHLDSDDEDVAASQDQKQVPGSSPADSEIEVVTL